MIDWRPAAAILFTVLALLVTASPVKAQETSALAPANPRAQLREILQRPLYQRWQLRQEREKVEEPSIITAARESLVKFRDWIGDLLRRLLSRKSRSSSASAGGGLSAGLYALIHVVAWIAVALFVVALGFLIWRLVHGRERMADAGGILSREQVADALNQGNALALRGDQWLDEAGRLAAEKDFRAMYRALYLALLAGLHATGKIVFDRHYTNWTYVTRYRGNTAERAVFSSLTDLFDSVWYGLKTSGGEDIHALRMQVESLTSSATEIGREARASDARRGQPHAH